MAVLYLVRHGHNDFVGRGIAGRRTGVHLTEEGRAQAERVAEMLGTVPLSRILCSPRERTRETAEPLALRCGLEVEPRAELDEIDFGRWEGASFEELEGNREWYRFNHFRSNTRIPDGEMVVETQARVVAAFNAVSREWPDAHIALIGHGDPIRLCLAYYAGIPIDLMLRLEISLASISVLELAEGFARIHCINHTANGPAMPS